jgi:V/A-type H+/Na+-transporting ATPase subunit E
MAEQLQGLLDRIQRDGVDKAKAEAETIIADARVKAADLIADAESKAATLRQTAERDGETFAERGEKALAQAARDVLLSLGESINQTVHTLVRQDVGEALAPEALGQIIADIAQAYAREGDAARDVSIIVPEGTQKEILKHVKARLTGAAAEGLEVVGDGRVTGGFKISLRDENVEHDFTQEAITQALSQLLRPHIAGILQQASTNA